MALVMRLNHNITFGAELGTIERIKSFSSTSDIGCYEYMVSVAEPLIVIAEFRGEVQ